MPNWKKLIVSGSDATLNSLNVTATVTANEITAETITTTTFNTLVISSSVLFTSGSNIIGDELTDHHQITGSVSITGSLSLNGTSVDPLSYTPLTTHTATSSSLASNINILFTASSSLDTEVSSLKAYTYRASLTGSTSYTVTHSLNEDYPIVQLYDTDKKQVIPADIISLTGNTTQIDFSSSFNGLVVVTK